MILAACIFMEVFSMCLAAFFLFKAKGHPFAEAASYAIITVFMLLSFIYQISFISGIATIAIGMEAFCLMASFGLIFRYRSGIFTIFSTLKTFGSKNLFVFMFLLACLLYMLIQVFLQDSGKIHNELYMINSHTKSGLFSFTRAAEFSAFLPINHLILFHSFPWFGNGSGAGIFCFSAYLSIGFSTYALARRYSWHPTAFTTAILVMSMPGLASQVLFPDAGIISAAAGLFCILAVYRTVELPNPADLILLILGLFFFISENISTLIFVPILFTLSGVVLFRRHGVAIWKSIFLKNRYAFFAAIPAAVFSQVWLFIWNHFYYGAWAGGFTNIFFNKDGIQGATANFIRYFFESFYLSIPPATVLKNIFNWDMLYFLQSVYDSFVRPFLGENGAVRAYHLTGMPDHMFSFGPVGFFLVIPALFYSLMKGPRRLKAVATAFGAYCYLISLLLAWTPDNVRFFEIFYVCSGFTMSFFFPPWRFTKRSKQILQASACILLALTLFTAL